MFNAPTQTDIRKFKSKTSLSVDSNLPPFSISNPEKVRVFDNSPSSSQYYGPDSPAYTLGQSEGHASLKMHPFWESVKESQAESRTKEQEKVPSLKIVINLADGSPKHSAKVYPNSGSQGLGTTIPR